MRAGRLRHRIVLEQPTTTRSAATGEPVDTWTIFASRHAEVRPLNGRAYFAARQHAADVTHEVELRYLAGVDRTMRVSYDGRVLEIESVIDLGERRRELLLMCRERV